MTTAGRSCERCNRGAYSAATRSHSNIRTKKRQQVNLQWQRRGGAWARLCTNCIKAGKKGA